MIDRQLEAACDVIEELAESLDNAMSLHEDTIAAFNSYFGLDIETESAIISGQAVAYKAREFVALVRQQG